MDDMDRLYEHQTMMAVSIYSFLDNLLTHVRQPAPVETQCPVRPAIEAGGYPEDMFFFLSERDKEEFGCSVCYCILKDAHQCRNNHKFCYTCIYVWSSSPTGGAEVCPMCRTEGVYARNEQINEKISRKRVKCQHDGCNWRGLLREFDNHDHRKYEQKELHTGLELPQLVKKPSLGSGTGLTSTVPSLVSTSEFLRSYSQREPGESAAPSPAPADTPRPPAAPQDDATISSQARRASLGPRRIVQGSSASTSAARRNSTVVPSSTGASGIANRPGMIPRPPAGPRPANANSNTGTNPARVTAGAGSSRPGIARRPSEDASTPRRTSVDSSTPTSQTPVPPPAPSNATTNSATVTATSTSYNLSSNVNTTSTLRTQPNSTASTTTTTPASTVGISSTVNHLTAPHPPTAPSTGSTQTPSLEYRRLAPRRPNPVQDRLREGREQLAMMLTLMTLEIEERRRNIERHAALNMERERVRLQEIAEVQSLNRRLNMVANNLERLLGAPSSPQRLNPPTAARSRPTPIFFDDSSSDDDI